MKLLKTMLLTWASLLSSISYSQWSSSTPSIFFATGYEKLGLGTSNPNAPLHIIGNGQANAQGWQRSIILDNNAALIWKGRSVWLQTTDSCGDYDATSNIQNQQYA